MESHGHNQPDAPVPIVRSCRTITGGVVSSLGKGLASAALGLRSFRRGAIGSRRLRKFDPYECSTLGSGDGFLLRGFRLWQPLCHLSTRGYRVCDVPRPGGPLSVSQLLGEQQSMHYVTDDGAKLWWRDRFLEAFVDSPGFGHYERFTARAGRPAAATASNCIADSRSIIRYRVSISADRDRQGEARRLPRRRPCRSSPHVTDAIKEAIVRDSDGADFVLVDDRRHGRRR